MRKPNPDRYSRALGAIVSTLTAVEKADLYATGKAPERLDADAQKVLRAGRHDVWAESDAYPIYEGRIGASPREMRVALLDAAQSTVFKCLSPAGRARRRSTRSASARTSSSGSSRTTSSARLPRREGASATR